MKASRRHFLTLTAACAFPAPLLRAATDEEQAWQKDVQFLLDELPKKAGHFFETKKIDWKKVAAEFTEAAQKTRSDDDHLKLCNRLVARLRDGHAGLVDLKVKYPDESKGRRFT